MSLTFIHIALSLKIEEIAIIANVYRQKKTDTSMHRSFE